MAYKVPIHSSDCKLLRDVQEARVKGCPACDADDKNHLHHLPCDCGANDPKECALCREMEENIKKHGWSFSPQRHFIGGEWVHGIFLRTNEAETRPCSRSEDWRSVNE